MRSRGTCGYADLLQAYAAGGQAGLDAAARLSGYRPAPRRQTVLGAAHFKSNSFMTAIGTVVAPQVEAAPLVETPFWLPEERRYFAPLAVDEAPTAALTAPEWPAPAAPTDLSPWKALLPRMRAAFTEWTAARSPDISAILRRLEKGKLLDHFPRRQRRRWGSSIQIIVDRSERLTPFWDDQDRVARWLSRLFPAYAVERATMLDAFDAPVLTDRDGKPAAYRPPEPGALVVALSDLGCLADRPKPLIARWNALGRRLAEAGCRVMALTPCPRARWRSEPARWWTMLEWERSAAPPPMDAAERTRRVERLLALAAPAARLEPALLRELRRLLGADADAGTEADLWRHPALVGRSCVAGAINPEKAADLRAAFHREDPDIATAAIKALRRHRADLPNEIWMEEVLWLDPDILPPDIRERDLPWAREHLAELAQSVTGHVNGRAWTRRLLTRGGQDMRGCETTATRAALSRLYDAVYAGNPDRPPPPGFDPGLIPADGQGERGVAVWQRGDALTLSVAAENGVAVGSPLVTLRTANGIVEVSEQPAASRDDFWRAGRPPAWATDWGRDRFGLWTSFTIGDVTQRLRWIKPGAFLMGSPKDERGRDDDEGPRHEVTLSRGFWLFDTACTQALWWSVMRRNPSKFKGDARPVDSVSWNDAQDFIRRINQRVPGLALTLPTEAQWEYACRAGTTPPFSFGADISPDQVNYDGNHPYGDGPKGLYRQETVPVASLPPNPWGLYEMHGNVWEWCLDGRRNYGAEPAADPHGPLDGAGGGRALRGGSWSSYARFVRAAYRYGYHSDSRNDSVGFRCARVQVMSPADPEDTAEPAVEPAFPGQAERRETPGATNGVLREGEKTAHPVPAGVFYLRTDREQVRMAQITRPAWADGVGRDRFGLWASFTMDGVIQRLRWMTPGRFMMGSPDDEPGRFDDEGPQHEVTLSRGFWLFDTACTQALWRAVMGDNPSEFKGDDRPVEQVSWNDAQNFIGRINQRVPGLGLTLPTEAQWEYACRAGTTTPFSFGADISPDQVNYNGNHPYGDGPKGLYRKETVPVASLPPNPWGLYEMHGNVWEWCLDGRRDYGAEPVADPHGSPDGAGGRRALRGGSWFYFAQYVRTASRDWCAPDYRDNGVGFRCARAGEQ